jgi:hypothetical protein
LVSIVFCRLGSGMRQYVCMYVCTVCGWGKNMCIHS